MKKQVCTRCLAVVCLAAVVSLSPLVVPGASAGDLVGESGVWYAKILRTLFPQGVEIHGTTYPLATLPCLPKDITRFSITAGRKDIGLGPAFAVEGSIHLGKVTSPFRPLATDRLYALHLQAFLIAPDGRVVWRQKGFMRGNKLVSADGGAGNFMLIGAYRGPVSGYRALVLAAGDPILSNHRGTRVLLGAKMVTVK